MEDPQIITAFAEFKKHVLGDISIGTYMALFFFSFIAILLSIYVHYLNKGKSNPITPDKFSLAYALWDNFKRMGASMLVMFLLYRFCFRWLSENITMEIAVGIGFFVSYGVDKAIQWIQNKTNFFNMPQPKKDE